MSDEDPNLESDNENDDEDIGDIVIEPYAIDELTPESLNRFRDLIKGQLQIQEPGFDQLKYKRIIENFTALTPHQKRCLTIDYNDVMIIDSALATRLINFPLETIREMTNIFVDVVQEFVGNEYVEMIGRNNFHIHIENVGCSTKKMRIRDLRTSSISRLIEVNGIVTKKTRIEPLLVEGVFQCRKCSTPRNPYYVSVRQDEIGKYEHPSYCTGGCRGKPMFKLRDDLSSYIDCEEIEIQENPEDVIGGDMPQSIRVILLDDLTGVLNPGNRCIINGVLKMTPKFNINKDSDTIPLSEKFIICIGLKVESGDAGINVSEQDINEIKQIVSNDPNLYISLRDSIAPTVKGMDHIKLACLYSLFSGGVNLNASDDMRRERRDSHILLIGDPSTGKGELLTGLTKIIPRGMYTSSEGVSAAGLLSAVVQTSSGGWCLEGGVLVLCDTGIALIDELDKMNVNDRKKLHTAMEQQFFTVSKAGINATLNTRTTLICAANPRWANYDPNKTWLENINLPPTIISRFDLIFVLRDIPDEVKDAEIALHIMKRDKDESVIRTPIRQDLLKKWIHYARTNIHPILSDDADNLIVDWYKKTRKVFKDNNLSSVITTRQLQAVKRLTIARARAALKQVADVNDVKEVLKLYNKFLKEVGVDPETGAVSSSVLNVGRTQSQLAIASEVYSLIKSLQDKSQAKSVSKAQILSGMKEIYSNVDDEKLDSMLEKAISVLKGDVDGRAAQIYESKKGYYSIVN